MIIIIAFVANHAKTLSFQNNHNRLQKCAYPLLGKRIARCKYLSLIRRNFAYGFEIYCQTVGMFIFSFNRISYHNIIF